MEFYKILASIMEQKQLSIPDVARACGLSDSTVRSIFDRKQKKIALNVAFKLSRGLHVSLERLAGETEPAAIRSFRALSAEEASLVRQYRRLDTHGRELVRLVLDKEAQRIERSLSAAAKAQPACIQIPFPLQPASAGTGDPADDESCEMLRVQRNGLTAKADYVMRAHGDSMEPQIHNGDLLLIRAQPAVEPGETGIFIRDGERYVKVFRMQALQSINPAYPNLLVDESTRCIGKVLGVLAPEWLMTK